eukprot:NODE_7650_length_234_cov_20.821622_g7567_i0.p1 GENE.NODE_7650_length_234_cov_20.821622_g7567_i0~~NODE_7650_length_234_cov_20.821622_g7567_i0.p1  ORF type:complete len:57 (-),score=15.55 NODE_7650_length_234_cov_20.821622_g7567_i0:62-205(-)
MGSAQGLWFKLQEGSEEEWVTRKGAVTGSPRVRTAIYEYCRLFNLHP